MLPLVLICLYTRANALAFMDGETPYYFWNKDKTNSTSEKIYDVLILGDSIANAAYEPSVLSDGTVNLALGGTTPIDGYYILAEWLENHPAPMTCYVSFADLHFKTADWFWKRIMFTHRFHPSDNFEIIRNALKYEESSILSDDFILDFLCYELWLPNRYNTFIKGIDLDQRYKDNLVALQNANRHAGRYMARGIREYSFPDDTVNDNFVVTPLFDEYYRRILDLCVENQIKVRLIKLPLSNKIDFSKAYRVDLEEYYSELKNDYPDISMEWFEPYESECFADVSHLNSRGALQFSTELKGMYPKDFVSSKISPDQIMAINDEIITENKIEWILKWTAGRDYTMVIRDTSGMFPQIYEDQIKGKIWNGGPELRPLDVIQEPSSVFYYILGDEDGFENQSMDLFRRDIGKKLVEIGTWGGKSEKRLDLLVIDNYNDTVVCQKTYRYTDKEYIYGE